MTNHQKFIIFLVLSVIVLWDLIWRGFALWRAARNDDKYWFFFLVFVNSIGILPIIYLLLNPAEPKHPKDA